MGLDDEQIAAIRATWAPVFASRDLAAGLFYGRLFQISPGSRSLFTGDPAGQGRKLTETLAHVVDHLDRIDDVRRPVTELARRHVDYGVRPDDYAAVGQALIWMLERLLGEALSPEARAAWAEAYEALARIMIAAAYPGVDAAGLRAASDLRLETVSSATDTES